MINVDLIKKARSDDESFLIIYNKIFYDNNKPKLRMWLIKKGISYSELDDVETEMKFELIKGIEEYSYNKIYFEKYIWTKFNHCLLNYFQSKKLKKNSVEPFSNFDSEIIFDIGFIPEKKYIKSDFEILFTNMTQVQATICRLIYYNEWNKTQIIRYLDMSDNDYSNNLKVIRNSFLKYLSD